MRLAKAVWPVAILCFALAALMSMFIFPAFILRPVVIFCFLLLCPGAAAVRFLRLRELATKLALMIALSFSIDGLVVGIFLYSNRWSPASMLVTLVLLTGVAVLVESTNLHVIVLRNFPLLQRIGTLLTHPLIVGMDSPVASSGARSNPDSMVFADQPTMQVVSLQGRLVSLPGLSGSAEAIEEKPTVHMQKLHVAQQTPVAVDIDALETSHLASLPAQPAASLDQQPTRAEGIVKKSSPRVSPVEQVERKTTPRVSPVEQVERKTTPRVSPMEQVERKTTPRVSPVEQIETKVTPKVSSVEEEAQKVAPRTPVTPQKPQETALSREEIIEKPTEHIKAALVASVVPDSGPKGDRMRRASSAPSPQPVPQQPSIPPKVSRFVSSPDEEEQKRSQATPTNRGVRMEQKSFPVVPMTPVEEAEQKKSQATPTNRGVRIQQESFPAAPMTPEKEAEQKSFHVTPAKKAVQEKPASIEKPHTPEKKPSVQEDDITEKPTRHIASFPSTPQSNPAVPNIEPKPLPRENKPISQHPEVADNTVKQPEEKQPEPKQSEEKRPQIKQLEEKQPEKEEHNEESTLNEKPVPDMRRGMIRKVRMKG